MATEIGEFSFLQLLPYWHNAVCHAQRQRCAGWTSYIHVHYNSYTHSTDLLALWHLVWNNSCWPLHIARQCPVQKAVHAECSKRSVLLWPQDFLHTSLLASKQSWWTSTADVSLICCPRSDAVLDAGTKYWFGFKACAISMSLAVFCTEDSSTPTDNLMCAVTFISTLSESLWCLYSKLQMFVLKIITCPAMCADCQVPHCFWHATLLVWHAPPSCRYSVSKCFYTHLEWVALTVRTRTKNSTCAKLDHEW